MSTFHPRSTTAQRSRRHGWASVGLLPVLAIVPFLSPASADGGKPGVSVPVKGTSDDGGTFVGNLSITGAGLDHLVGPVLVIQISGAVAPSQGGGGPTEDVHVTFPPVEVDYGRVDKDADCIVLELRPPSVFDADQKRTVDLDPVQLSAAALPGPANLLAELICANDDIALHWTPEPPSQ